MAPATSRPWEEGFGWPSAHRFDVPGDFPTGLYKVSTDGQTVLTFVVRASNPGELSKILLQISVNTPNAYNKAGGKSLYDGVIPANRGTRVSFDRPEKVDRFEDDFILWAGGQGLPLEYCTSIDIHDGRAQLERYNLLLSVGHDEVLVEGDARPGGGIRPQWRQRRVPDRQHGDAPGAARERQPHDGMRQAGVARSRRVLRLRVDERVAAADQPPAEPDDRGRVRSRRLHRDVTAGRFPGAIPRPLGVCRPAATGDAAAGPGGLRVRRGGFRRGGRRLSARHR